MKKFTEKAQDYFDRHPMSAECHITSDERVFHTIGSAQSMAGTLDNQDIESYKRTVLEKEQNANKNQTEGENEGPSPAEKLAMEVFLSQNDVEKLSYEDQKKLVKFFDLKVENQKSPSLIAALADFKTTLNK